MKLKLNIKTEDELDLEAFERDLVLSDYMEQFGMTMQNIEKIIQ